MKIKCPFCKNVYDPEAHDNTCPACNKRLLVTVFKKPAAKPGAAAASGKSQPSSVPTVLSAAPAAKPPPALAKPTAAPTSVVAPASQPAAPEPEPVPVMAAPEQPVYKPVKTEVVAPPPPAEPVIPPAPVIVPPMPPPPAPVAASAPVVAAAVPAASTGTTPPPPSEKKHAHTSASAGCDLVISIHKTGAGEGAVVIRVPVKVLKLANLIPARAREAVQAEGIDIDELRKAVEHAEHIGPLLDIQTPTERIHLAVESHAAA